MSKGMTCACGKQAFLSEAKAKDVLVRAKIAFSLYGNKKRREQRAYECNVRRGTWHLTSQPLRTRQGKVVALSYALDDVEAAREYISGALFHRDGDAWEELLGGELSDQTLRALGLMHQSALLEASDQKKALSWSEYRLWRQTVAPMMKILENRIGDARQAVKRVNLAQNKDRQLREGRYNYALARRLALEIAYHRKTLGREPDEADEQLWGLLDQLYLPRGTEPIGELIARGDWFFAENENPLNGRIPEDDDD